MDQIINIHQLDALTKPVLFERLVIIELDFGRSYARVDLLWLAIHDHCLIVRIVVVVDIDEYLFLPYIVVILDILEYDLFIDIVYVVA